MTPEATVDAFIAAIERKDIEAAVALTAPDVSYENMPVQPVSGHEGLAATLAMFLGPADEVDWRIVSQVAVGQTVVNERLDRFRIGSGIFCHSMQSLQQKREPQKSGNRTDQHI